MKHVTFLSSFFLLAFFHLSLNAADFGTSGYGNHGPDEWYSVDTHSYPEVAPLSLERNLGTSSGRVYLSPTGITIGEAGDYEVSVTAILQNPEEDSVLIPFYLSLDETFDPEDSNPVGGVGVFAPGEIATLHGDGFIRDVAEGTRLSLVITNGGYPESRSVLVAGWAISVKRIE